MNDNVVFQPGQTTPPPASSNTQTPAVTGGQTQSQPVPPPVSPGVSASVQSAPPIQPPLSSTLPPASPSLGGNQAEPAGSPRITLTDLYGPSQSVANQPAVEALQPVQPVQPESVTQPLVAVPVGMHEIPQESRTVVGEPVIEPPVSVQPVITSEKNAQVVGSGNKQTVNKSETLDDNGGFHFSSIIKFAVIGVLVVILLLVVWGIGSFILSSRNASNEKVNLTYWGLWEDSAVMQPILADFQRQHPNITVTYTKEDPKDYVRRLLTRIQGGNGPDIFRFHNTWVFPLQSVLLPLPSSVIDKNQLDKNFPPVVSSDMVVTGAVYGLPLEMDTLSLFVNSDIFTHAGATVPTSWENFITTAKALTVKDPSGHIQTSGAAIGTYENITHSADIVSLLLLQNGANIKKLDGSQNAKDALDFYTSFAKPDGNVWDNSLDNSLTAFSSGKVAMYFGYSYDIFAIKAANPNLNFAIYPVPHLPGRDMTVSSYWAEGVSTQSKHPKESMELLQYLAQKDTETNMYTQEAKERSFGELYAKLDLADELKSNPLLSPFVSQYKTAQSSFFVGDTYYDEYNGALNRYLGNGINSILKDTSPESALTTISQGVAQVTSQFVPQTTR